jgi:hypothetical protein
VEWISSLESLGVSTTTSSAAFFMTMPNFSISSAQHRPTAPYLLWICLLGIPRQALISSNFGWPKDDGEAYGPTGWPSCRKIKKEGSDPETSYHIRPMTKVGRIWDVHGQESPAYFRLIRIH